MPENSHFLLVSSLAVDIQVDWPRDALGCHHYATPTTEVGGEGLLEFTVFGRVTRVVQWEVAKAAAVD